MSKSNHKLTKRQADAIKSGLQNGETQVSLAKKYGVSITTIRSIKNGKTWANRPNPYKSKLTQRQAVAIRRALGAGQTGKALAHKYGVATTTISSIKTGRTHHEH